MIDAILATEHLCEHVFIHMRNQLLASDPALNLIGDRALEVSAD